MKVVIRFFIFALFAVGLDCAWIENVTAEPPKSPSLSEVVLFGVRSVKELKQGNYPEAGQTCVRKYLDAIPPKSCLWLADVPSGPEGAVHARRRNLVEQIVAVMGENARDEAKAFSFAVPLYAEWEGMSEGPVGEADFVDQWVSKRPNTPIVPFLHLFKAHRLRAGFEAARARNEKGLGPILAKLYRDSIDVVRSSTNPLISCIASDLEAQPHVYLEGQGRP